jgi:hypothetical protein
LNTFLLSFPILNPISLVFRFVEKVNADPVPAISNLFDELLRGLFILVVVGGGGGAEIVG